jgi:hypothetical protein
VRVAGGAPILLPGKVDSGATATVIPRVLLPTLGLRDDQLQPAGNASSAGGQINAWRLTVPVTLRVAADQQGSGTGEFGPAIMLSGLVSQVPNLLLGQRDFFASFTVSFHRGAGKPRLVLAT